MKTKKIKAVFCEDGSYSGGNFSVLDVSKFTPGDWVEIEEAGDNERLRVAEAIAKSKQRPISKMKDLYFKKYGPTKS